MTITNYTFFSPNGTEFPVSANADGKLYMMLTGMELNSFRIKHWEAPVDTALNRQYTNTSIVLAGRYFELTNETVVLSASSTNYIHANIDLANASNPVSISVEQADNSTAVDINNSSGVIKRCFDIVDTSSSVVTDSIIPKRVTTLDTLNIDTLNISGDNSDYINLTPGTGVNAPAGTLFYRIKNGYITIIMSNIQTTIDSNGQKLVTTLPISLFSSLKYVGMAFTGNSTYPFRVSISGKNLYVNGGAGIRSNNITWFGTLPLP